MKFSGFFYLLLLLMFPVFSQEKSKSKPPKVGLVLSGGGAKGFAHIGVLKVLEKSGVKIDYIGGTSMGAVVGALYASGYSPENIDSIIRAIDFPTFLQDKFARSQTSFFEKQYGEKTLLTFPVRNKKVQLPKAIAAGQSVYNGLSLLLEHVNHIQDFKKLPIPFFCIGTNIETGKKKVFEKGYLPAVVRASASLPTLLDPMMIDGKAYIDGGISDNFPVDEMQKKGASIIIGVNVQGKLEKYKDVSTVIDVLNQIVNYQMYGNDAEKIKKLTIHISPKIHDFSVTSFDNIAKIIDLGEQSAIDHQKEFEAIAKLQQINEVAAFHRKVIRAKKYKVSQFSMNNLNHYSRAYILGKLKLKMGDSLSYNELNTKIGDLASSKDFNLINYNFKKKKDGSYLLKFNMEENNVASHIRLGLNYDPIYKSGFLMNFTSKHLLQKNDILSADIVIGDNIRTNFNYFVDNGFYTSYGVNSSFTKFNIAVPDITNVVTHIDKNYIDFTTLAYLQTTYNKKFAVGIGLEHKFLELYTNTLSMETTFFEKSNYLNSLGYIKLDTYDKKYFPKNGFLVDGEFKWFMNSSDYWDNFTQFSQATLKLAAVKTMFHKLTAHITVDGGVTLGSNTTDQFLYSLGGYGNNMINNHVGFYGYEFETLVNHSYLKGELELRYEIAKDHTIALAGNYARTDLDIYNGGKVFQDIKSGYALMYGYNSILGPIKIINAWTPDVNRNIWYFCVGMSF
ncbi:patatin-like phospholipase family protein [Flavicella sediminum]|uniref:patatin-like phospholipase family protein n=1 Tax=Flavicella sediminum TaxID=2585141 RepID=UPI001120E5E0|nr:patatin-like phospholipase family protein [Flavicella sediminum]